MLRQAEAGVCRQPKKSEGEDDNDGGENRSHNHVAASGVAAALAMPSMFVELVLLHSLVSFGTDGAAVNAPAFSIALGDFFVHRLFIIFSKISGAGLLFFMLWRAHVCCPCV